MQDREHIGRRAAKRHQCNSRNRMCRRSKARGDERVEPAQQRELHQTGGYLRRADQGTSGNRNSRRGPCLLKETR